MLPLHKAKTSFDGFTGCHILNDFKAQAAITDRLSFGTLCTTSDLRELALSRQIYAWRSVVIYSKPSLANFRSLSVKVSNANGLLLHKYGSPLIDEHGESDGILLLNSRFPKKHNKAHKANKSTKIIRFIGNYSFEHNEIRQILTNHWQILEQDKDLSSVIGTKPTITFRRSKNLRDQQLLCDGQYLRPHAPQKIFYRFVDKLNSNSINLKVTAEINRDAINFLDIRIYRDNNNDVQTTVFRKDTATNNLLHAKSQHPSSLIQGIPTGQYLRVKRICSTETDFKKEADKLYLRFKQRAYSHNSLKRAYKRALGADRNQLLIPKKHNEAHKANKSTKIIRFIGNYSFEHNEIRQILTNHWQILEQDKDLSSVIGTKPTITFRRSKNLRDQLVHSHLNNKGKPTRLENKTKGCHKCGSCLACPYIEKAWVYVGRDDKPIYTLEHSMNCKTSGVIYVMTCQCGKCYVGKTKREFRRRILEHVGDVKHKRNTSVARHINETHNGSLEMLKFTAVDLIEPTLRVGDIDKKLLQREAQWIYWLNTRAPNGLNEGFTFSPFL
ncbi:hypothetical protein XELAEV_18013271mg [Xenopus laevis]|uniref:GIY-YIG domain-containing protein n=1 Tax=Xenopus laevis TaxID=8355 RepID=A0A974HZ75_XENLA|nr:hypothetical protein XELAEV_18013271mg [Xenopus laevis]